MYVFTLTNPDMIFYRGGIRREDYPKGDGSRFLKESQKVCVIF